MREVLIVAAEASADLHGAGFVRALQTRRPGVRVAGIGGVHLDAAGAQLIARNEEFAVMGFVEIISHVPRHWLLMRRLRARLRGGSVGLVVLLDYPGFNLRLASVARAAGVPVLYYITPQVWAWGKGRLAELARTVTKAACILPFEEELLRAHGVDAEFVGHPLLDRAAGMPSAAEARARLNVPDGVPLLGVFPGSREQELRRHLRDCVATANVLTQRIPGLRVIVSGAPTVALRDDDVPFPVVRADSFGVLRAADAALCKSGTTTLEAAVAGCPLVVVYRTNALTYAMARRLVRIPAIGLVNVVAGRVVAPEFIQQAFRPDAVASALEPLLDRSSPARVSMTAELDAVRGKLGTPGAADRVAAIADGLLA